MENNELKLEMKRLWLATFHDSEKYVDLIFDRCFDQEYIEYEEENGCLVSAMMGIPIYFGNADNKVKGVYLCGLATRPESRGRGLMTGMLDRIASRMREKGIAFLFLIPASATLADYYRCRGYVDAFYRVRDNYTNAHDFAAEYMEILETQQREVSVIKKRYYSRLLCSVFDKITGISEDERYALTTFIMDRESRQNDLRILHSAEMIYTAIDECIVSDGMIWSCRASSGKITSVAFSYKTDDGLLIYYFYSTDRCSRYRLLDFIKRNTSESGLTVFRYPSRRTAKRLLQSFYGDVFPSACQIPSVASYEDMYSESEKADVYGMARILNLYEILKFVGKETSNLEYSILVKEGSGQEIYRYKGKRGLVERAEESKKNLKTGDIGVLQKSEQDCLLQTTVIVDEIMTESEVAAILFRRPDSDPFIGEVFGLPSLRGEISLMLD